MRTRILLAVLATVLVAGCSGGGGTNSSMPPAPQGPGTGTQATTQEISQAATEAAFGPIESGDLENGLYNGSMGVALSSGATTSSAFASTNGACHNGKEFTVTVISSNQKQYELKTFYDSNCTKLGRDVVALVTRNSASSESITRTATNYNLSGLVLSTRKANYSLTGTEGDFSAVVTSSVFIGTSTSPSVMFGRQFTIAPQNSTVSTIAATSGRVVNVPNPGIDKSFGHMGVLQDGTKTIDSSDNIIFAGTHSGTFIRGPYGALTLSSTPPFTVSGGTTLGTTTVTGSVTFDSTGDLSAVSITGTLWNGDGIVVTSSGSPGTIAINGTITNTSGQQVATFSVDQFGDGVITYANGGQALIIDWHVVR
jgi:hypothetical protein